MLLRILFYLVAFVLAIASNSSFGKASFAVAPGKIYFNLTHPATKVVIIRNNGDERIHIRLAPIFMPINSHSLNAGISLAPQQEKKHDLSPFMLISPRVLSLQPGEQRTVRISLHPPTHLSPGTYRAHLLAQMLEVYKHIKHHKKSTGMGMHINLLMEIAIAIYGNQGTPKPHLKASCTIHQNDTLIEFVNKSPWHFNGVIIYPNKKEKHLIVYRNSKLKINLANHTHKTNITTVHWHLHNSHNIFKTKCHLNTRA